MTTPGSHPDWDAVARYLGGESDAAEAGVVRAWLEDNPADAALVRALRDAADAPPTLTASDVEAALASVHRRMAPPAFRVVRGARRGVYVGLTLAAAAAAFLVFMLRSGNEPPAAPAGVQRYATAVGARDSLLLPDSSRVILGPRSRLTVFPGFGDSTRTVALTGDAYFDVRHDAARPFRVATANASIEDIGTTFAVEADSGAATAVVVTSGSVRLRFAPTIDDTSSVVLAAGDRGIVDARGRVTVERGSVGASDVAWTRGQLVFRDAPLTSVSRELERWYGVHIVADSALFARHVTASFNGESIDQVLHILGLTLGVTMELRGDSAAVVSLPARGSTARP
jgi:transmembrane sensor